jgi:hypothetical protein
VDILYGTVGAVFKKEEEEEAESGTEDEKEVHETSKSANVAWWTEIHPQRVSELQGLFDLQEVLDYWGYIQG